MEEAYRNGISPLEFRKIWKKDLDAISRIRSARRAKAAQKSAVDEAMRQLMARGK